MEMSITGGRTCGKATVSIGRNMAVVPYCRHGAWFVYSSFVYRHFVYSNFVYRCFVYSIFLVLVMSYVAWRSILAPTRKAYSQD